MPAEVAMSREELCAWVRERLDNCHRLAATKTGADRAGWLEDARYFSEILNAVPQEGRDTVTGVVQPMAPAVTAPRSESGAWLPVSDPRRPEVGVNVLTFNNFDLCTYSAEWTGDSWSHFCGDGSPRYTIRNVTHWRKCPEAPK